MCISGPSPWHTTDNVGQKRKGCLSYKAAFPQVGLMVTDGDRYLWNGITANGKTATVCSHCMDIKKYSN